MTEKPISIHIDAELRLAIEAIRKLGTPIPSVSDVMRKAVMEKYARDVKANGASKHRNGK